MKQRIITGLILTLIGIPALYFGGIALKLIVLGIALIGVYEFVNCRANGFNLVLYLVILTFIAFLVFTESNFLIVEIFALLIILFILGITSEKFTIDDISMDFVFAILFGFTILGILQIYSYGGKLMIFIVIAALICDAGAYFTGYFFGKHKLNKRISPNKTIEGAIGGWIIGGIAAFIYAYYVLVPLGWFSLNFYLLASTVLPVTGIVGDLSFSLIKRHYSIKDFGNLFPGHGGVLDRFDSLTFCTVVFEGLMLAVILV